MYAAPPVSCTKGGVVRSGGEEHVTASKNQIVERLLATICICEALASGSISFSKQWLALKNHGSCELGSVSLRSWPVHRNVSPALLKIICAIELRRLSKVAFGKRFEHFTSISQVSD